MFPADILEAIRANGEAWTHFQGCSPAYQRIRVAYIDGARVQPEVFKSRLESLVKGE